MNREDTRPRKYGCVFRLCRYLNNTNEWPLNIFNGMHNHRMERKLEDHLLVGRLTKKDKKIVVDLTRNFLEPKYILMNFKDKRKDNLTNIKQVCNARERFKKSIRAKMSVMQCLFTCIENTNMFISVKAKVSILLFKIYFGLILNYLSCLKKFQLFSSWTPHIKPTCT